MTPVEDPKPAIQSISLWALASMAIPFLGEVAKYLGALPPGVLPTPVTYGIMAVSWGVTVYRKLYGDNKPISGLLTTPDV